MKMKIAIIVLFYVLMGMMVSAQQFTAMEGSIYGGAVNTGVQPASGVNMPYRWDVEVVGINSFWNNNIYSFSPTQGRWRDSANLNGQFISGNRQRWGTLQADVHLLNFLFRWPRRNDLVIGAGWNMHSRLDVDRLDYLYEDTMKTMRSFLQENAFNKVQQAQVVNQQWMEWYITGSKVIFNDSKSELTAGATLKLLKGMAAIVIDIDAVSVGVEKSGTDPSTVVFTSASGRYGYSKNVEEFSDDESTGDVINTLFNGAPFSPSISLGISYLVKKRPLLAGFSNDDPANYDWKLEASLTDIGRLKYPLGSESKIIKGLKGQTSVDRFSHMVNNVSTLNKFNDSLATMTELEPWSGSFSVSLPTALRINVDKNLGSHFYVNARMVLGMSFLNPGVDYKTKQISYLTLTPRWEIKRVGIYAPFYINTRGSLMAGAAFRLGPLLAGVHDFKWLFQNSNSGGAYIALVIRGLLKGKDDCPTF